VQRTPKPPLARTVSGGFSFWPAQLAASMITVLVLVVCVAPGVGGDAATILAHRGR